MSLLMTCNQAWLLSVHPTKSVPTHDCKGIYNYRWPYFWLGGQLATTLIRKLPRASFGGQAPRWYLRLCRKAKRIDGIQFTMDTGTINSYDSARPAWKIHQNHAFSTLNSV